MIGQAPIRTTLELVDTINSAIPAPARFAVRRVLRIYPGLLLNVLVCAFLIGPLISALPVGAYFASPELRQFLADKIDNQRPRQIDLAQ